MSEGTLHIKPQEGPAAPLVAATAISAVSFFFHMFAAAKTLGTDLIVAYIPLLLGLAAMWLCFVAIRRTAHKRLATVYAVILAPFAFSYPAWMALIWMLYISGRYAGPVP
jgi:hypothetical protein